MLRFLTAGESHGPCLTAIVEGLPAGLAIDIEAINRDLARRQGGYGRGGRMKIERDRAEILGGVIAGRTTGAPVALRIENRDWANWRDRWAAGDLPRLSVPRPGHADYAGMVKYGLDDVRPVLERASARETAARVAAGGLAKLLLAAFGIRVGSVVTGIGVVVAAVPDLPPEELWALAEASDVRCPDEEAAGRMRAAIDAAREAGDSLGGEIGPAFENARRPGTQVHDEFEQIGKSANRQTDNGTRLPLVMRTSNRAGGIEGGMSNGQPIVVRAAMKPIPTTVTPLRSVDLATGEPAATQYQRSDVCAVPAASVVGEAMVAWVLADALVEKWGGDSMAEMRQST
jgi:chorismate synthase